MIVSPHAGDLLQVPETKHTVIQFIVVEEVHQLSRFAAFFQAGRTVTPEHAVQFECGIFAVLFKGLANHFGNFRVAGDGGALIWPQLIGYAKAKELLMTGDIITAKEAVDLGLINYAVPTDELDDRVAELVKKLQANPRWAVRWTKTVANIPLRALAAQVMDAAIGWESVSNFHDDRKEAVAAMKEKRKPRLTGE